MVNYCPGRTTLERQIQMQDQMRERMVALQVRCITASHKILIYCIVYQAILLVARANPSHTM